MSWLSTGHNFITLFCNDYFNETTIMETNYTLQIWNLKKNFFFIRYLNWLGSYIKLLINNILEIINNQEYKKYLLKYVFKRLIKTCLQYVTEYIVIQINVMG